jgi:thiamine-phosphate pyrophosphorylase
MSSFQTYLVSPLIRDADVFRPSLEAAIAALQPASVLLRFGDSADERGRINLIKALAPLGQAAGVAVLVDQEASVAVRGGADGIHAGSVSAIGAAREVVKGDRIVGAGGLISRHDAMDAGEAGADYVMFGEPRTDGGTLSASALIERAAWWAELFETPCVAYAAAVEMVAPLAGTRAEFIALGPWCFEDTGGAATAVAEARR